MGDSWLIETEKFMAHVKELAGDEPICTVCDGEGCSACCAGVRPDIVGNIYERGRRDVCEAIEARWQHWLDAVKDAEGEGAGISDRYQEMADEFDELLTVVGGQQQGLKT